MDVSHNNLREINSLNQRGGRMLSVVDLIEDGTLDAPLSGWLLSAVAGGASFLTAAGPGGVGKTTLMACLLGFLPPDERILTVTDPADVPEADASACYLCHEIGSGHWYGYLWGEDAARFLALQRQGRIAGSLHADTVDEVRDQLLGPQVGAQEEDLAAVDLLLFMVRRGGKRRVSEVCEAAGGESARFEPVAGWDPGRDVFTLDRSEPSMPRRSTPNAMEIDPTEAARFIDGLVTDGVYLLEDVMAAVADLYARGDRDEADADGA